MNLHDGQNVNRAWKNIREAIKISFRKNLGLYEQKQRNHGLLRNVSNFYIKGSMFKCSFSKIQTKVM